MNFFHKCANYTFNMSAKLRATNRTELKGDTVSLTRFG